jgi:cytochrome c-type biogenesis protein CcmH
MGWIWIALFSGLALLALWKFAKFGSSAVQFTAATLLLGVAGYAMMGSPSRPGAPVDTPEDVTDEAVPESIQKIALSSAREGSNPDLALADALMQAGRSRAAAGVIKKAIEKSPNDADLWVGLGNALFVHGGAQMNPASQLAFERAAQIAPNHPGPPFFLGYSLARSGKIDEAGEVWRGLLSRAPKDAPWRADLEQRLAEIGQSPSQKKDK